MSYRQSVHWIKPLVVLAIRSLTLCISQKPGAGAEELDRSGFIDALYR
jgi:hypothetical protein